MCNIPSMNVGYHGINQTKPSQGFQRLNHLNPQLVIPSHGWTPLTITRSVSTQVVYGSKVFVPTWLPRIVTQPTVVAEL